MSYSDKLILVQFAVNLKILSRFARYILSSWVCSNFRASRDAFPAFGFALNFRASRDAFPAFGFALILKTVAAVTTSDSECEIKCACP